LRTSFSLFFFLFLWFSGFWRGPLPPPNSLPFHPPRGRTKNYNLCCKKVFFFDTFWQLWKKKKKANFFFCLEIVFCFIKNDYIFFCSPTFWVVSCVPRTPNLNVFLNIYLFTMFRRKRLGRISWQNRKIKKTFHFFHTNFWIIHKQTPNYFHYHHVKEKTRAL